jgi:hypothetical protein
MRPARELHIARCAGSRRIAVVALAVTLLVLALLDPPPRVYGYRSWHR